MLLRLSNFLPIFIILLYNKESRAGQIEIKCTENCICNFYENLRRATCVGQRMLDFKDTVPKESELLDFSYNYVAKLEENEFVDNALTNLKLLNLSHNKINEIHIHAFNKMDGLKTLDLSHNAMRYVLDEWFWGLTGLEELYINNNNLENLKDGPIFKSHTLKILNLAYCNIPYLSNEVFTELKALQHLDLTGNYVIDINYLVIADMVVLQSINLKDNKIICNGNFEDFMMYCKEQAISFDYDFCKIPELPPDEEKFQRMVIAPSGVEKNGWIYDEEEINKLPVTCPTIATKEIGSKDILIEIAELSPVISVIVLVTVGFLCGLIIGCTCKIKPKRRNDKVLTIRPRRSNSIIRRSLGPDQRNLILNAESMFESTPMVNRRVISF